MLQSTFLNSDPRPHFAGKIENVTVNVGREAVLECPVNHLGRYKVRIVFQTNNFLYYLCILSKGWLAQGQRSDHFGLASQSHHPQQSF